MTPTELPRDQEGWSPAKPEVVPRPTYFPMLFALSAVFILFGLVTMWPMSVVGVVLIVISLIGWIGEMRHDQRNELGK